MSEKLYKLEQIIELFDEESSIPERSLIFTGPDYPHKATFPKDRMTLIFYHKLYDWYGQEVELEPGIKQVLNHFGCLNDKMRAYETFVVERNDGRLAIAMLDYKDFQKTTNNNLAKMRTTSWIMVGKPFLTCHPKCSFARFQEMPGSSANCLNEINKWLSQNFDYTCKICLDVISDDQSIGRLGVFFWKTYGGAIHDHWMTCRLVENRNNILKAPNSNLPKGSKLDCIYGDTNGNLLFSEDGSKMTAFTELWHMKGEVIRISTDIDVIMHTRKSADIFWYYDPEP